VGIYSFPPLHSYTRLWVFFLCRLMDDDMGKPRWQWLENRQEVSCEGTGFGLVLIPVVHFEWTQCPKYNECRYRCKVRQDQRGQLMVAIQTTLNRWDKNGHWITKDEQTARQLKFEGGTDE